MTKAAVYAHKHIVTHLSDLRILAILLLAGYAMNRQTFALLLLLVVAISSVLAKPPPQHRKKHYLYRKPYHNYPPKRSTFKHPVKRKESYKNTKPVQEIKDEKPLKEIEQPAKISMYTKKGFVPVHIPINVPMYEYGYKIHDAHNKNFQEKTETKIGDAVQGYYSLLQPDGDVRVVKYQSDNSGFHSKVSLHKVKEERGRFFRE